MSRSASPSPVLPASHRARPSVRLATTVADETSKVEDPDETEQEDLGELVQGVENGMDLDMDEEMIDILGLGSGVMADAKEVSV
jgi:hypothetical protein